MMDVYQPTTMASNTDETLEHVKAERDALAARVQELEAGIERHRDAPDVTRFKAYRTGRFSANDTHLYQLLAADSDNRSTTDG